MTAEKDKLKERLAELNIELQEREATLQDKIDSEIKYYGKPLGKYSKFQKKIDTTERKIIRVKERIRKTWMTNRDTSVLSNLRNENNIHKDTTSYDKGYGSSDSRFNGSYNSRKTAKLLQKRGKNDEKL
jgi:ABC-type Fe3+-citrate transport system substrate-binding protein